MKFLNEQGQEITLKRAENLPGYEVTLSEDVVIDSAVNNPFFKGINILQLPKKLKGFRDNKDLQSLLEPKMLKTGIQIEIDLKKFLLFEPALYLLTEKRLQVVNRVFGNGQKIEPMFVNFGLKKIKLEKGTIIGHIFII
ncbi:hypothetical protein DIS13_04120 [Weissella paramesenteroides]|uniref:hypothetical protein n=1 Tax=Weissella paramesenteroides TaxID=1249 RepID=UPI00112E3A78|nr:hypothetical protein [Weissella paramesenteroides]TPF02752.1 hypothetical protein DIS13_04120 [Weissella paramesenteroides]